SDDGSGGSKAMSAADRVGGGDGALEAAPNERAYESDGKDGKDGKGGTATSARVLPADRTVVYRAEISVRVKDVEAAALRAEGRVSAAGGLVSSEQTSADEASGQTTSASMTLRVPPADFRDVLDDLGKLGTALSRTQTAEDVTGQLVDVQSRVETQKRSVARVRALLDEAATVGEVVQIESELARREADLESMQAQLAKLEDVTDLATIELSLVAPDTPDPGAEGDEDLGFLAGLKGGWDAFVAIVLVGLTVLGALVPFLVTAVLVGVPGLLVWRSRRRPAAPPAA
ncbi:MAG: DUF4349 domain-containing protein, partial [Actinomycetes bacterium]